MVSLTKRQLALKDRWCTLVAALTCPCHIPVAVVLLGGTAGAGGVLAAYQGWLMLAFGLVWLAAVALLFGWRRTTGGAACPVKLAPPPEQPGTGQAIESGGG